MGGQTDPPSRAAVESRPLCRLAWRGRLPHVSPDVLLRPEHGRGTLQPLAGGAAQLPLAERMKHTTTEQERRPHGYDPRRNGNGVSRRRSLVPSRCKGEEASRHRLVEELAEAASDESRSPRLVLEPARRDMCGFRQGLRESRVHGLRQPRRALRRVDGESRHLAPGAARHRADAVRRLPCVLPLGGAGRREPEARARHP